jgi:nucleoside 2-deoxyribosyltransferase
MVMNGRRYKAWKLVMEEDLKRVKNVKAIYIAGKLSDPNTIEYIKNVSNMMDQAQAVKELGFSVFVPAIDILMGIKFGYDLYSDYFDNSLPWLAKADAVILVPGWETSKGTKRELAIAEELGIPVFENIIDLKEFFGNE